MNNSRLNLIEIHRRLMAKLNLESKAKQDAPIALQMQTFLSTLKNRHLSPFYSRDPVAREMQEQADMIIEQATNMLNANRRRSLSLSALFRRRHGEIKAAAAEADDIFEEELAAVLATIEQKATGQTVQLSDKLIGGTSVGIEIEQVEKEIIKAMQKAHVAKSAENTPDVNNIVARSGKADVLGTTITYEGDLNPQWEELFKLFQGKTFSVKSSLSLK